ncbi:hypothetical protein MKX01_035098 [Papaver californicum]|nr:hypothetical protein MKX01_035098 [Papaver californicum]
MDVKCIHCGALHWMDERLTKSSLINPLFGTCCIEGQIKLPGLRVPPKLLEMFDGNHSLARRFLNRIRRYNNSNVFTSLGCSLEPRIFKGKGPPSFTIHGELRHRTGSIVPGEKRDAVFS